MISFLTKYSNYNFPVYENDIKSLNFEDEKYVFIISKKYEDIVTFLESKNYIKKEYKYYYILEAEN